MSITYVILCELINADKIDLLEIAKWKRLERAQYLICHTVKQSSLCWQGCWLIGWTFITCVYQGYKNFNNIFIMLIENKH